MQGQYQHSLVQIEKGRLAQRSAHSTLLELQYGKEIW